MTELDDRRGMDIDFHIFRFAELGIPHDQKLHDEAMKIIRRAEQGKVETLRERISSLFHRAKPSQDVVKISDLPRAKTA